FEDQSYFIRRAFRAWFCESRGRFVVQTRRRSRRQRFAPRCLEPDEVRSNLADFALPRGRGGNVSLLRRRGSERIIVAEPRPSEKCLKAVIVRLRNRIKLMVVTARAANCQPQKDEPRRFSDVVEGILSPQTLVVQVNHVGIAAIESGGDESRRIIGPRLV